MISTRTAHGGWLGCRTHVLLPGPQLLRAAQALTGAAVVALCNAPPPPRPPGLRWCRATAARAGAGALSALCWAGRHGLRHGARHPRTQRLDPHLQLSDVLQNLLPARGAPLAATAPPPPPLGPSRVSLPPTSPVAPPSSGTLAEVEGVCVCEGGGQLRLRVTPTCCWRSKAATADCFCAFSSSACETAWSPSGSAAMSRKPPGSEGQRQGQPSRTTVSAQSAPPRREWSTRSMAAEAAAPQPRGSTGARDRVARAGVAAGRTRERVSGAPRLLRARALADLVAAFAWALWGGSTSSAATGAREFAARCGHGPERR
jgi:hypothetical protein